MKPLSLGSGFFVIYAIEVQISVTLGQELLVRYLFLILSLMVFSACSNTPDQADRANMMLSKFHSVWQHGDIPGMMAMYDHGFLASQGRDAWQQKLQAYQTDFGILQVAKQRSQQLDARFSGDYYIYRFRLRFEKGSLSETITLYQPLNQDEMHIVGHVLSDPRDKS